MKDLSTTPERRISVRIPGHLYYLLISYCQEQNQSPSAVIRAALAAWLTR